MTLSRMNYTPFRPLNNLLSPGVTLPPAKVKAEKSFAAALQGAESKVKVSQHAMQRMAERKISLPQEAWQKLSTTIDKMAAKGAKEGLIYMQNTAFVVSVSHKMIITAVDGKHLTDNIFTNIDSAAII